VCTLLNQVQDQNQINTIRTRLLLYFLALFVDKEIPFVRDINTVASLVVDKGLISEDLKKNLPDWLRAGRRYVGLVDLLNAGLGILIFLPLLSPSTWESHCPLTGMYVDSIKHKLKSMGVPEAANATRYGGRTGHDVVQELMEDCFPRSSINFVTCDPATGSPSTGSARFIRKPRDSYSQPRSSPDDFSSDSERPETAHGPGSPFAPYSRSPTRDPRLSECCHVFKAGDPLVDPTLLRSQYSPAVA
jgi:hypothetical protein